ncbi:MAG: hypothetical protein KF775_01055 [Cyclobacteriaceae bacterium]|nr:hypothetical protein [Cytophagales bacterium]MBX2898202.1 hypothetical protein [Cyclobacteriaceae bacterium]
MEATSISTWNTDRIIEDIQHRRVIMIQDLLKDQQLNAYLAELYDGQQVSQVKSEFLKRDLKTLSESPIDLVHYSMLIRQAKEATAWPHLPIIEEFIHAEIRQVVIKYIA